MGGKILELYSEKLLRRGRAIGYAEGYSERYAEGCAERYAEGVLKVLRSLVQKGLITISTAAKELGVSEEDFKKMAAL